MPTNPLSMLSNGPPNMLQGNAAPWGGNQLNTLGTPMPAQSVMYSPGYQPDPNWVEDPNSPMVQYAPGVSIPGWTPPRETTRNPLAVGPAQSVMYSPGYQPDPNWVKDPNSQSPQQYAPAVPIPGWTPPVSTRPAIYNTPDYLPYSHLTPAQIQFGQYEGGRTSNRVGGDDDGTASMYNLGDPNRTGRYYIPDYAWENPGYGSGELNPASIQIDENGDRYSTDINTYNTLAQRAAPKDNWIDKLAMYAPMIAGAAFAPYAMAGYGAAGGGAVVGAAEAGLGAGSLSGVGGVGTALAPYSYTGALAGANVGAGTLGGISAGLGGGLGTGLGGASLLTPYSYTGALAGAGAGAAAGAANPFADFGPNPYTGSENGLDMLSGQVQGSGVNPGGLDGPLGDSVANYTSGMGASNAFTTAGVGSGISDWFGELFKDMKLDTPLGQVRAGGNILSAISQFLNAGNLRDAGAQAAALSDPFAAQRPQYQAQLAALMANPAAIQQVPGYASGLQAVERRGAAQGWNGGGAMMDALANYGGNFYNQELTRLMQLAGANFGPGYAGTNYLQGQTQGGNAMTNALAQLGLLFPRNA